MNRDILDFVTFCIGALALKLNMPRGEVFARLNKAGLVKGYLSEGYAVLHTFSRSHNIENLQQPTPESRQIILDMKIASVIAEYATRYQVSLEEATETFYNSVTAQLIEERIADLHCRSDQYLADELWLETHPALL